jgi:hypothetical protein
MFFLFFFEDHGSIRYCSFCNKSFSVIKKKNKRKTLVWESKTVDWGLHVKTEIYSIFIFVTAFNIIYCNFPRKKLKRRWPSQSKKKKNQNNMLPWSIENLFIFFTSNSYKQNYETKLHIKKTWILKHLFLWNWQSSGVSAYFKLNGRWRRILHEQFHVLREICNT